jgi:signal transduction histidine kinase/CheY-like chemotaxis protein
MIRNPLLQYLSRLQAGYGVQGYARIDRFLVCVFWLHLPAGLLVNYAYGIEAWPHTIAESILIPLVPTAALFVLPKGSVWMRLLNGLTAMGLSGWLIHMSGGTIEFHFHVFVFLAVLSYYRDPRVLAVASVFIMLHHLILNFVSPYDVFAYGPRFSSVLIHALFVTLESSYLTFNMLDAQRREEALRQATKTEAIGQLTGGIAHDFNNLLTIISGNTELLMNDMSDPAETKQSVGMIAHAAGRAAELTQRLLAFGRQQPLSPRHLDLNEAVANVEKMLRRTLGEHVTIRTGLTEDLWMTFADRTQVESALLNLAVNARDAMPNGGQLSIETANVNAHVAAEIEDLQPGAYVALTVRDTGSGMRPEVKARAFDPFFTTKEIGKGTGLGLSMVYGFVKQSGGHAAIESVVGKGTSVRLYLPRLESGTTPETAEIGPSAGSLAGTETVLVVEDDEFVRAHAAKLLQRLGYTVVEAAHGPAALAAARDLKRLDLLFTDVVMPGGMNGRQLAEALVQMRPGLHVLYTSGYPSTVLAHDGHLDAGVQLLAKPYRQVDLARKVRDILDGDASAPERAIA